MSLEVVFDVIGNKDKLTVERTEDVDRALKVLAERPKRQICAVSYLGGGKYEGAHLTVGIDFEREVGWVVYRGYDSFVSQGPGYRSSATYLDDAGEPKDYPDNAEVSLASIHSGLVEFLNADGALPRSISWADEAP